MPWEMALHTAARLYRSDGLGGYLPPSHHSCAGYRTCQWETDHGMQTRLINIRLAIDFGRGALLARDHPRLVGGNALGVRRK